MRYRNPRYTADGRIDCEIEHPTYGWIPFTADPNDPEKHGRDLFAEMEAAGGVEAYEPPPGPTPEEIAAQQTADRIAELKQFLRDTDYVALPDYDKDKADVLVQRQAARDEIRELSA